MRFKKLCYLSIYVFFTVTSTIALGQKKKVSDYNLENINRAIEQFANSSLDTLLIDKKEKPWVLEPVIFKNVKNKVIIFDSGTELNAKANAFPRTIDAMWRFVDCENIVMEGNYSKMSMNKAEYIDGEWRHVISIRGSNNIKISNLELSDSGGDGVAIGRSNKAWYSKNIYLDNIQCLNNKRQGISIMSAENVWVTNSCFAETIGTAPGAGVDLEPNVEEERMVNINFENCQFKNNYYAGINIGLPKLTGNSQPVSIVFDNCSIENNFSSKFHKVPAEIIIRSHQTDPVKGSVVFKSCTIANSKWRMLYARKNEAGFFVTFENCVAKNICNGKESGAPIYIEVPHYNKSSDFGGYHFENLKLQYDSNAPTFTIRGTRKNPLNTLRNVSGTIFVENPNISAKPSLQYLGYLPAFNENVTLKIKKLP